MLNFGVLGSGNIVKYFVSEVKKFKDIKLVGIWGRHEEKLKTFENEFNYYTTDLDQLLNDPKINVIYVALPNGLHYEYAMKVLKAGKHAFVEKPFTVYYHDSKTLLNYANKHNLLCLEAIMPRFNPNLKEIVKKVSTIGDIKMVDVNFSQYSSRYDRFKIGTILPVFDKKLAGGALLDLNVYNIHFVVELFGAPKKVTYFPNMQKGVDVSGVLILDYGTFKASLIAAKDCKSEHHVYVQGDCGYIKVNSQSSACRSAEIRYNDGKIQKIDLIKEGQDGFYGELNALRKLIKTRDEETIKQYNKDTLIVAKIMDDALKSANIKY